MKRDDSVFYLTSNHKNARKTEKQRGDFPAIIRIMILLTSIGNIKHLLQY